MALHARRGNGGMAANPIAPTELAAWLRLRNRALSPDEVDLVFMLDDLWLSIALAPDDEADTTTPPLTDEGELDRDAVAAKLRATLGLFAKKK